MVASAKAVFEADSGKLDAALLKIQGSMLRLQKGVAGVFLAFKAFQAAGRLIASQAGQVKSAFDMGGELNDMSARTGIAVGELAVLRQEFANAGKAAEDVGPAVAKMQKSLATGKGDGVIQKMGISLEELKSKTPADQFHELGAAIAGLQSPLDRVHAATAVFGKSGTDLLSVFSDGNFGQAAVEIGGQAQILEKNAALFDDVSDKLNLTGVKVQGFFVGVAEKVAPILKPLLDKFAAMDFSSWGQQIGDVVAFLIQTISDGSIAEILGQSVKIAMATAANFTLGAFTAIGRVIGTLLSEAVKAAVLMFEIVTTADFWKGLGNALVAAAKSFTALLLDGVALLLNAMRNVPWVGGKIGVAADATAAKAQEMRQDAAARSEASAAQLGPAFEKIGGFMTEAMATAVNEAKAGFEQGMAVFDTGAMTAEMNDTIGKAIDKVQSVSEKSLADAPTKQVNAIGDELLNNSDKEKVAHLQRIGGGGLAGVTDPARLEQKRTNSLLADMRGLLRDIRGKVGGPSLQPSGAAVFG